MTRLDSMTLAIDFSDATAGLVQRGLWLAAEHRLARVRLIHVIDARILDGLLVPA